jgi:hypothetical protein
VERARQVYGTPGAPKEEPSTVIEYTAGGFTPAQVSLPCGSRVVFRNGSATDLWPASDCNTSWAVPYCDFDAGRALHPGEEFGAYLEERRTVRYANKLRPSHAGSIDVHGSALNPR